MGSPAGTLAALFILGLIGAAIAFMAWKKKMWCWKEPNDASRELQAPMVAGVAGEVPPGGCYEKTGSSTRPWEKGMDWKFNKPKFKALPPDPNQQEGTMCPWCLPSQDLNNFDIYNKIKDPRGGEFKYEPIYIAIISGHVVCVATAIANAGEFKELKKWHEDEEGWLKAAILRKELKMATMLRDAGVSTTFETIERLLSRTGTGKDDAEWLALWVTKSHVEVVRPKIKNLLGKDGMYSCDLDGGWTVLHNVAYHGFHDAIPILLEKGAGKYINKYDWNGATPLHYAAIYNHPEVISQLLAGGADASLETKQMESGEDPLERLWYNEGSSIRRHDRAMYLDKTALELCEVNKGYECIPYEGYVSCYSRCRSLLQKLQL